MPIQSRRLFASLGLLCTIAICGWFAIAWSMAPNLRINHDSYTKIRAGMTMREVCDLLGCPPHIRPGDEIGLGGTILTMMIHDSGHAWQSDGIRIYVCFDAKGITTGAKMWAEGPRYVVPKETLPQRLLHWFQWRSI